MQKILGLTGLLLIIACNSMDKKVYPLIPSPPDPHSYARVEEAVITHLDLDLKVDFTRETISGFATYQVESDSLATTLVLDVKSLQIDSVMVRQDQGWVPTTFAVGSSDPVLGAPLSIDFPGPQIKEVKVFYQTTDGAVALQWLNPQQTYDKKFPFLFTQGQAVLTRSWIPIQDSPGIRFTYKARITVPRELLAVMSATNPQEKNTTGIYDFTMEQPIPAYLMALAVGDIRFSPISERCGVYAEPGMIDAATFEFADLEKMVKTAEALYGPYLWVRYDLIVLPPSFPFGGMENPRLTFATPTIITGDRSLTALVAHELAHSWSGNLVTNATWEDFWINEGHTVFLENRIMEALYGKEYADMLALLGYQDLTRTIADFGEGSANTHLKLNLKDRDPDDGMNDIAYEKGALLLKTLEQKVGRDEFDRFLRKYFQDYQFKTISTEQWEQYVYKNLLDSLDIEFDLATWLYNPGIPSEHIEITSNKFREIDGRLREFVRIGRLDRSSTRNWTTHEWLHFIRGLPTDLHESFYEKIDDVFQLSDSGNAEILAAWFEVTIRSKYMKGHNQKQLTVFLTEVGRRKFLIPLYRALVDTGELELARSIFTSARANYHSVSINTITDLLSEKPTI